MNKKDQNNGISRFSLTITREEDQEMIEKFKGICKKRKKRYTNVALELIRNYTEEYEALR